MTTDSFLEKIFWSRVDKTKGEDACWEWTAYKTYKGYGQITYKSKGYTAHKLSLLLSGIPIPIGAYICHRCDNPSCVNPKHLFIGNALLNAWDRNIKGRGPNNKKELNGRSKLTETLVKEIRETHKKSFFTYKELAQKYNVSISVISRVVNNQSWKE